MISELKLDVNRKFEENINIIEMLKNKIYLENNNKQIKWIKKDIFFIRHKNIEEFIQKNNLKIDDLIEGKLDLDWRYDNIMKILENLDFLELKKLYLEIKDLKGLENVNFPILEILNIHGINSNINILEKMNFRELKELSISSGTFSNIILDIQVLEKLKYEKLEKLRLSGRISDINILEKVKFKELKILDLSYNNISDINIL